MPDRVRLNPETLRQLLESPHGLVGRELARRTARIERTAKRLCPVDTGRLRASITSAVELDSAGLVGRVGTGVDYAVFVEVEQPYLRPALAAEVNRGA